MKKNLLTIGLIALSLQAKAQKDDLVYVGNASQFFVGGKALVFSGGNLTLDSSTEKTVMNHGNIKVVGDYKKGTKTEKAADDGKEFVNFYDEKNNEITYGQVQLLETDGTRTTGRMTTERPAASEKYFGASYAISFPYEDKVTYLMKSFGLAESDFKGDCVKYSVNPPKDADCGGHKRYAQTLTKWNNNLLHHDAVEGTEKLEAGHYYNINLRNTNINSLMKGIVGYKGKPAPQTSTQKAKGIIAGKTEKDFGELEYNYWKELVNPYAERYRSYLGNIDSNSKLLNKNVYRFGNPFTSNLDLSDIGDVENGHPWLKINNVYGMTTLKQAYGKAIKFTISKRTEKYDVDWGIIDGNSYNKAETAEKYYTASYDGTNWTGSGKALIIAPTETFNLNITKVNTKYLPNRILSVTATFNDNHKTFDYVPSVKSKTTGSALIMSSASVSAPTTLAKKVNLANNVSEKVNSHNFVQAEIFLVKDNNVISNPAYLVGANYNTETSSVTSNETIYTYGVSSDESIAYDNKVQFRNFNSLTYVGKPLGIGFNNLNVGENYELRFNLYEDSIFNEVKNIGEGSFYIKDNTNSKVTEISADKSFAFTATENMDRRFEIYWKEVPIGTLANDYVVVKADKTTIYTDNSVKKVRFEKVANKANIEVYDMAGRLVSSEKNINTSTDYALNLTTSATYVVKVIYTNGEVRTLKITN